MVNKNVENGSDNLMKSRGPWRIILIIFVLLIVSGAVSSYLIIQHNNKVLNSWKTLYQEENKVLNEEKQINSNLNKIIEADALELEKIKELLQKNTSELIIQRGIVSELNCQLSNPLINLKDVEFAYSGNTSMHRELKKFVEGRDETITTSNWNLIWNNVDVGMHKITVKGNIRYYFITFFKDKDFPELVNSVFWLDRNCFLDYPGFN